MTKTKEVKTKADINDATIIEQVNLFTVNGLSALRKACYKPGMTVGAYRQTVKAKCLAHVYNDPKTGKPLTGKALDAKRKVQASYGLLDVQWDMERGNILLANK